MFFLAPCPETTYVYFAQEHWPNLTSIQNEEEIFPVYVCARSNKERRLELRRASL
jgi:hypothetical protein